MPPFFHFFLFLFTLSVVVSTLILSSIWRSFLWWPCSQAVGLYLVRPMIKSAGLTSASDRPIHPTDTPPPPHTGRLNNLCTISNMKEDLLTLQSPPAPFPISLDCGDGYTASNRVCLHVCVCVCVDTEHSSQLYPIGVWQFWLLSNFMDRKMRREGCNWKQRSEMVKEHSEEYFEDQ